jgi:long-chain acyl-CoA synthetase
MNTHGNVVFNSQTYRDWCEIGDDDVCLAVAPLFHITGLIGHIGVGLLTTMPLVLSYRFDPGVTADLVQRWKATFTVASITVFIALMNDRSVTPEKLATLKKVYSGGAPVAPSVAQAWEERFGSPILIAYGLTETNSPSHFTPLHNRSPVDENTGALSVGVPVFNTVVRILGENGEELAPGEIGELATSGRRSCPGTGRSPRRPSTRSPTESCAPATSGSWTSAAGSTSSTARRTRSTPRATRCGRARSRTSSTSTRPCARRRSSAYPTSTGRDGQGVRQPQGGCERRARRAGRVLQGAHGRLQVPAQVEVIEELPKTVTGKILRRELRVSGA